MSRKLHRPLAIAEDEGHKFVWLGLDEADLEKGILTNQYLVVDNGEAALLDPGGYFVFQRLYNSVAELVEPDDVKIIFYSHQDPDVIGSLNLVAEFFPNAKVFVSSLWTRFLPHLGTISGVDFVEIPDSGGEAVLGSSKLRFIQAHFLHSPGNFTVYDEKVKVLFSGDIGAAVFPGDEWYLFVEDFDRHVKYIEGFHRRYLCCKKALDLWLDKLSGLEIKVIAPQHGAIFGEETSSLFLEWLSGLQGVGTDLM